MSSFPFYMSLGATSSSPMLQEELLAYTMDDACKALRRDIENPQYLSPLTSAFSALCEEHASDASVMTPDDFQGVVTDAFKEALKPFKALVSDRVEALRIQFLLSESSDKEEQLQEALSQVSEPNLDALAYEPFLLSAAAVFFNSIDLQENFETRCAALLENIERAYESYYRRLFTAFSRSLSDSAPSTPAAAISQVTDRSLTRVDCTLPGLAPTSPGVTHHGEESGDLTCESCTQLDVPGPAAGPDDSTEPASMLGYMARPSPLARHSLTDADMACDLRFNDGLFAEPSTPQLAPATQSEPLREPSTLPPATQGEPSDKKPNTLRGVLVVTALGVLTLLAVNNLRKNQPVDLAERPAAAVAPSASPSKPPLAEPPTQAPTPEATSTTVEWMKCEGVERFRDLVVSEGSTLPNCGGRDFAKEGAVALYVVKCTHGEYGGSAIQPASMSSRVTLADSASVQVKIDNASAVPFKLSPQAVCQEKGEGLQVAPVISVR